MLQTEPDSETKSTGNLVLRCDAGGEIGAGHVMRCLALAQQWQDRGGRAIFATRELPTGLEKRLKSERMELCEVSAAPGSLQDSQQTIELSSQHSADWVVLDGYAFGSDYQRHIVESGRTTLVIDDDGCHGTYVANLLLNQNLSASASLYRERNSVCRLLLGCDQTLLRREYQSTERKNRVTATTATRLLVTLGGADPPNFTATVLKSLSSVDSTDLGVTVVLGASNPHRDQLEALAANTPHQVTFVVNTPRMSQLIEQADLAVSAAGSTCWELAFWGTPAVVVALAGNQSPIARALHSEGVALNAGWHADLVAPELARRINALLTNQPARESMSQRGRALVDGQGARRVVDTMEAIAARRLSLREVA